MISKELLSAVLDKPVTVYGIEQHTYQQTSDSFVIHYEMPYKDKTYNERTTHRYINVYELAHKCKDWANKKGYILSSALHNDQGYCELKKETQERIKSIAWCPMDFNTEVEAIFSACQYILDNQSNIKE